MKHSSIKYWCAGIIWLVGITFISRTCGVIFYIILGKNVYSFFRDEDGESTLTSYQVEFWLIVIAIVVLYSVGGKLKYLLNLPYGEDPKNDKKQDNTD